MSEHADRKPLTHLALAGAVSGVVWRAVEPSLRRLFGHPYSDPELVTAFVTEGPAEIPLDYVVQAVGGAAVPVAVVAAGGRSMKTVLGALAAENLALLAASPLVDRIHPYVRQGRWPRLTGNPRAAAVSLSGHALYGALVALFLRGRVTR